MVTLQYATKNSDGTYSNPVTIDTRKISIVAEPDPKLPDSGLRIKAADNTITLHIPNIDGLSSIHYKYLDAKLKAIREGGSDKDYGYEFSGLDALVSEGYLPSLRSVHGVSPNECGDIQLLSSKEVDVTYHSASAGDATDCSGILISHINRTNGVLQVGKAVKDLHLMVMKLYHVINHLTARMLVWSPDNDLLTRSDSSEEFDAIDKEMSENFGKLYGTLLNYQAVVARWNILVWERTYILDSCVAGVGLALSIGYTCIPCSVPKVVITTTIVKVKSPPLFPEAPLDAASCLTIYKQGVSDNRSSVKNSNDSGDSSDPSDSTKILKFYSAIETGGTGGSVVPGEPVSPPSVSVIHGLGTDPIQTNWEKIVITQEIHNIQQAETYSELFSLFPINETVDTRNYINSSVDPSQATNTFSITTDWSIYASSDAEPAKITRTKETIAVPAITAEPVSPELDEDPSETGS